MNNIKLIIFLFAITFLSSSCATLFCGSKQIVQIASEPSGAKIEVDGIERGQTPAPVKLKRNGQVVSLKKEGYKPKTFEPETTFNAVSILNLFSFIGWGIDLISGAVHRYDPKYYNITLEKDNPSNK